MSRLWRVYYDDGSTFDSSQGAPHRMTSWLVVEREESIRMADAGGGSR